MPALLDHFDEVRAAPAAPVLGFDDFCGILVELQAAKLRWSLALNHRSSLSISPFQVSLIHHFRQVYVWLNALQNSGSRCDRELAAKIVRDLPKSVVERCHTFVRAIKLVLQGLDESRRK